MCAKVSVLKIGARRLAHAKFGYSLVLFMEIIYCSEILYRKISTDIKCCVLLLEMRQISSNLERNKQHMSLNK